MYAQLCKRLSEEAANYESSQSKHGLRGLNHRPGGFGGLPNNGPAANNDPRGGGGNNANQNPHDSVFSRILLNTCKNEFESRSKAHEAFERRGGELLSPEDEERRATAKRKMLGNIKFIGELGKLEIVSNSILHRCILQLLDKRRAGGPRGATTTTSNNITNNGCPYMPEDIECLCQIMRTCGRILDQGKSSQLMEQYFERMNTLAKSAKLPLRIRFMLRDVIELRQGGWVPRKATSTEGPMPINQIRGDHDDHPHSRMMGGHHHHHNHQGGGGGGMGLMGHGPGGGPHGGGYYNRGGGGGRDHDGRDGRGGLSGRGDPVPGVPGMGGDMFRRMGRMNLDNMDSLGGIIPLSGPGFGMHFGGPNNGFGPGGGGYGGGGPRHNNQRNNQPNQNHNAYFNANQNSAGGRPNNFQQGKQNQQQQQHLNQQQNFNNNGNKEPVRFNKNKMLIGPPEEVSLRPSANSMTFKQPNIHPPPLNNGGMDLFPGRLPDPSLMRAAAMRKPSPPLIPKEEPPSVVIKQGPVDKRDKARERKDNKGPTKEDISKKVNSLMDEFLSKGGSIPTTISAFKELKIPERFLRCAVYTVYSNSLERNDSERNLAADLMRQLRKDNVINNQQYHDGWKELVASIGEKDGAVPCCVSHIAQLTARAILDSMLQLSDLAGVTENGQHYPLFLLVLQQLHKQQGKPALAQIFAESKVNLLGQLPEADKSKERLGEILEDRDLTFLYPLLRIQGDMWRQLEADPSPNSLYKWIKEKLDPAHHAEAGFINALMAVLLKYITQETTFPPGTGTSTIPEKSLQEKELNLLGKYQRMLQTLLPTIDSQVTAVHSLQVFCLSLGFPKGMLLRWFISLYDLSIVDEDAFMRWKEDVNDAYPGKGDALFQVNAWLTWLAEQPSEDEDEEEEEKADN